VWGEHTYARPQPNQMNSSRSLNFNPAHCNRSNYESCNNFTNVGESLGSSHRDENRFDYEHPHIRFPPQQPPLCRRYESEQVFQKYINQPYYHPNNASNRPLPRREASGRSDSEPSSISPRLPKIDHLQDDLEPVVPPRSLHKSDEKSFFRIHPYLSADIECSPRRNEEKTSSVDSNVEQPYCISVPRKDTFEPISRPKNLDGNSLALNLSDKHSYDTEVKSIPDTLPPCRSRSPHLSINSKPPLDLGPALPRPIDHQFQYDGYYRPTQLCQNSQYYSKPPYPHVRSLHSNMQVQYNMPVRRLNFERCNSLPSRSFSSKLQCGRSSPKTNCLNPSRKLNPRQSYGQSFEDSESEKCESESRSHSLNTSLLPSIPSTDAS